MATKRNDDPHYHPRTITLYSALIGLLVVAHLCQPVQGQVDLLMSTIDSAKEDLLNEIGDITTGNLGSLCISRQHQSVPVPIRTDAYESARQKADMMVRLLQDLGQMEDPRLLKLLIRNLVKSDGSIQASRVVTFTQGEVDPDGIRMVFMAHALRPSSPYADPTVTVDFQEDPAGAPINATTSSSSHQQQSTVRQQGKDQQQQQHNLADLPWFEDPYKQRAPQPTKKFMVNTSNATFLGWWTFPYYLCSSRKWHMTYSIPVSNSPALLPSSTAAVAASRLDGLLSIDVSVSWMDINQCDSRTTRITHQEDVAQQQLAPSTTSSSDVIGHFEGTHKCHRESSTCHFKRGHGWIRGGYVCKCLKGYYSPYIKNGTFNGSHVELAYKNKMSFNSQVYDQLYQCVPCAPGCDECNDDSPCLAPYDWTFRIVLLVISMSCVLTCICLMAAVYNYRRLKVFKVASPVFLCVTLLGCAIMYAEMAAIFPYLNTPACVATKWTRHMGFCITYSSLLMKTWRVSLTYRVKSAHKLKLTDRQLLHWMLPILLVATVYLGAWTASDPPTGEYILTGPTMRFTQCTYNWWDHSAAIGEMFFLMWGIHVCYSIRNAETYFNETKHISWAIYNITVVNIVMASFHLLLLPNVGPDMKYLLGFIRTQLSTTVTIILVFGPKFYLVARGRGDEHDPRARARGVTASFSLNGISVPSGSGPTMPDELDEPVDLCRENEELKEQLQKLAGHMEFMKIVHMGVNNPHLKPKPGGYFATANQHHQSSSSVNPSVRTLEPSVSTVQRHLDSDGLLLSRKESLDKPNVAPSSSAPPQQLAVNVEDVLLMDDSPTAELLPSSGGDPRPDRPNL